jgi:hypothetical protein
MTARWRYGSGAGGDDFDVGGERYRRLTRPLAVLLPVAEGRLRAVATRMSWPMG